MYDLIILWLSEIYENIRDIIYFKTEGKIFAMIFGAKFKPRFLLEQVRLRFGMNAVPEVDRSHFLIDNNTAKS